MLPLLRVALLVLAVDACTTSEHPPPDMAPPAKPSSCGKVCTADDRDCGTFSYENLPPRCQEVCYLGGCCELVSGAWEMMHVDCARPVADGGVAVVPGP